MIFKVENSDGISLSIHLEYVGNWSYSCTGRAKTDYEIDAASEYVTLIGGEYIVQTIC